MSFLDVLNFTEPTGKHFSASERAALLTSLPLLATKTKKNHLTVWGKIYGVHADYIIVQGRDLDAVATPDLYYSLDGGLNFAFLSSVDALLPPAPTPVDFEERKMALLPLLLGPFMGDPAYEYNVTLQLPSASTAPAPPAETLAVKESLRLALFVAEHDFQCRVAPRGAYRQNARPAGEGVEVLLNGAFPGLPRTTPGQGPNGARRW